MKKKAAAQAQRRTELVIITGLSGSGKGTVLKALEDLGYYSVDNLPIDLITKFAELAKDAPNIRRAALVVDIREGHALDRFPALFKQIRGQVRSAHAGDDEFLVAFEIFGVFYLRVKGELFGKIFDCVRHHMVSGK